jgi:hypothetical protein
MIGIEVVVGEAAKAVITITWGALWKIIKAAAGKINSRKLEQIQSEAFREILKGDGADMAKVEAILSQLSKAEDTSRETVRLRELVRAVSGRKVRDGRFITRKLAAKKAAAKKPSAKKVAAKKSSAVKVSGKKTAGAKVAAKKPMVKKAAVKKTVGKKYVGK